MPRELLATPMNATWRAWCVANRDDIAAVSTETLRDADGIQYMVSVTLRSLSAHAFERGEDQQCVWDREVNFGCTDGTVAGGHCFVRAAREQEECAEFIAALIRGAKVPA
jgi:hypothetical protein